MRLSIPIKAAATAAAVLAIVAPIQLYLVASWDPIDRTPLRLALLFVAPYALYASASGLFAYYIVYGRTRRLTRVLDAISRGELKGEIPAAIDDDLLVVRTSLLAMRTALDELTTRLRHTDGQRRRLFSDLAHELAAPTTTILATAETLASPELCKTDDDRAKLSRCLDDEASRLGRLVRDIRDLARLDDPDIAFEREAVDIADLARRAAERMDLTCTTRPPISVTAVASITAEVDRMRIDQVLVNILTNAFRYSSPGGIVTLAVTRTNERVAITIEDDGKGVPDDALAHLGERLFRVDPSRSAQTGGSGLGLAIVAAVVHRHNGALRFERASIGGLRVVVELPA